MRKLKKTPICLLALLLTACQAAEPPRDQFDQQLANKLPKASHETRQKVRELLRQTLANQVFIEGGSFIMGDWGAVGDDGVWRPYFPPTAEKNKAHKVTLSNYSLGKYKITWEEYDTFLLATGRPLIIRATTIGGKGSRTPIIIKEQDREPYEQDPSNSMYKENPADDRWQDAKDYCLWLAELTGLPFDLTTDAQYEYAARNRGLTTWLYPTHDGKPIANKSDPYADKVFETGRIGPVGTRLPANPLGIYDLAENTKEWVNDWFSPTYYSENDGIKDPQGPDNGSEKVVRSLGLGSLSFSFSRINAPEALEGGSLVTHGFRCAVNSPKPITLAIPE
ncbi:formylglycine-generating enzyme family protein [Pseudomonas sp.]|uniref:formylglycine-generating enzyme family protein n=1 Tax=Pseudomonas sp. TaxID=306 RepID=UPI00299DF90F|nr:SUMF1/EgtB/PvdO family nonheme iron enzyme [Pseudomonas sp.]MDX1367887.1 SUMF1/EgtB/PvdO family nonheme iron enzyme [Pseudomonas sp.]